MADTLADLKADIADDLARSDLSTQIGRAVSKAIRHYQSTRFFFNEGTLVFSTVDGQAEYGSATSVSIDGATATAGPLGDLYAVDTAMLSVSGADKFSLRRMRSSEIEESDTTSSLKSQPAWWGYFGRAARLYPTPDGVYSVRLRAHYKLAEPSGDSDTSAWTKEAADLVAARAKWHLAMHVIRDAGLAASMREAEGAALAELTGRTARVASTGQVAAHDL